VATEVTLPELGESVTEGTITEWLVEVGDEVNEDDPLFELSSDKIDTEVPSPASGILKEIRVNVDETVEVGTVVAIIGDRDEEVADAGGGQDDGGDTAQAEEADKAEVAEDTEQADDGQAGDRQAGDRQADDRQADDSSQQATRSEAPSGDGAAAEDVEVTLPELGESVTEGTITEWLVEVGDEVNEDDPLFELSSDKIDTEVPSPASGILKEIRVDVDETVEVGTVVAIIGSGDGGQQRDSATTETAEADEGRPAETDDAQAATETEAPERESAPAAAPSSGNGGVAGGDALMSPIVRRMLKEHDLDPAEISGSGQGGRITRDDVKAAISGRSEQPAAETEPATKAAPEQRERREAPAERTFEPGQRERVEKLSRIRQRIAARMRESQEKTASLTTVQEADMTRIMKWREQVKDEFKRREGASLSPFVFLARAAVIAIKRHPAANARPDWEAGEVLYRDYVNLGIAVDTERGLLVPNVKNADDLTLAALARSIADVATRARGKGQLEMSDIQGGTFTVTNTGSRGVLIDTPILNYPEVAILGTGAIQKRPVVVTDNLGEHSIAIRDMVYLCLTYDHQILDGADAARFVTDIKEVVETHDWEGELGLS
jgi:2-oxoglutarate dehydrogenase E2 component (dihydrolipoamide succinyltransferase)